MVITKTPFRMSFFGGGTDFNEFYNKHGGAVLSTTFDKYCYVTVREFPPFFEFKNHITYSKDEKVNNIEDLDHPLIRNTIKYYGIDKIRLIYEADLPTRSGLGTSSSFAVGMINAFNALQGKCVTRRKAADDAIYIERVLCNEAGGIQDQIAASFGGFNRINFSQDGYTVQPIIMDQKRKQQLNDNLMLFFTGMSRFSANIQEETKKSISSKESDLLKMLELVDEAENILTNNNIPLDNFGKLLDYTWRLKRGISNGISNNDIDIQYQKALEAGALGGKLLGAGGGGFMLYYVPKENQDAVKKVMEDKIFVPFKFENEGSQIIYYKEDN